MQLLIWILVLAIASEGASRPDASSPSPPAPRVSQGGAEVAKGGGEGAHGPDSGELNRYDDKKVNCVDGIPGLERSRLKKMLYGMLGKMKRRPRDAVHALLTGEAPRVEPRAALTLNASAKGVSSGHPCEGLGCPPVPAGSPQAARPLAAGGRGARVRRRGQAVMYLPINQEKADPCAPPKGSKLMEALPLVFLSSLMSVADAVGNVVNNINNNNNNNNNNNDNNINNDNTNLAANINNANQINLVPLGGRALRLARALVDAVGSVAMRAYRALVPGSSAAHTTPIPPTTRSGFTPTTHKSPPHIALGPSTSTTQLPPVTYKEALQHATDGAAASSRNRNAKKR